MKYQCPFHQISGHQYFISRIKKDENFYELLVFACACAFTRGNSTDSTDKWEPYRYMGEDISFPSRKTFVRGYQPTILEEQFSVR